MVNNLINIIKTSNHFIMPSIIEHKMTFDVSNLGHVFGQGIKSGCVKPVEEITPL